MKLTKDNIYIIEWTEVDKSDPLLQKRPSTYRVSIEVDGYELISNLHFRLDDAVKCRDKLISEDK